MMDDNGSDLETALNRIDDVAAVLWTIGGTSDSYGINYQHTRQAIEFLAGRLSEYHDAAHGAFCRIYKLDKERGTPQGDAA